ncbi:MAG TPA: hypothetical protein VHT73_10565 [Thermodesulfobacteriota bacterium]|nr:hypothetical protein [Thermodesulfobacteriota bacterium]
MKIYLAASDVVLTVRSTGEIEVTEKALGDDTVTCSSALLDGCIGQDENWTPNPMTPIQWTNVTFLFADHLGITKDPAFTDNVLFLLLEKPKS